MTGRNDTNGPRRPQRSSGRGDRRLKQRVKTAKGRTNSSRRWLERQLNDPYVAEAKRRGYRSRAAFKLAELDDRFAFLKPGARVVDLGAAPGGWSQVAAERVRSAEGEGRVVAIDLHGMEPIAGVTAMKADFYNEHAMAALLEELGAPQADIVISDMAAHATGHRQTDHLKIMSLCEDALDFACQTLAPGGTFLCKVLRGGTENELLASMKKNFRTVKHVKPAASRDDSAELYVLASGFRGGSDAIREVP